MQKVSRFLHQQLWGRQVDFRDVEPALPYWLPYLAHPVS
jgi:hypothetical protein